MRGMVVGMAMALAMGTPPGVEAQKSDEAAVLGVIEGTFDAMRAKDGEAFRSLFLDNARLVLTSTNGEGVAQARTIPIDDFVANIAGATAYLDEQIWDEQVLIHDNLAHVWVKYAFFVDEQFSHCGVDSIQLFKSSDGWKIFHIADTQRRDDCWMPPT